ncbi:MAG: FAD:protein FMN transferase [Akkermansiaceae bacterium]
MAIWPNTVRSGLVALTSGALLTACATSLVAQQVGNKPKLERYQFSEAHLGTIVSLVFYSDNRAEAKALGKRCFEKVVELDGVFSDYRDDSELMALCKRAHEEPVPVSDELFTVLSSALKISAQSGGAFDITVGASSKAWRLHRQGKQTDLVPGDGTADYRDVILDQSKRTVRLNKPLQLDLGGIAKGYIADELARILKQGGIGHFAVSVGGEIVLGEAPPGKKGWKIRLEDAKQQVMGAVELSHTAVSTSGDSYQFTEIGGKRSAHVLNPKTGKGKEDRCNVTVIAASGMLADGWATALRVAGVKKGSELAGKTPAIEALFTPRDAPLIKTTGFPGFENKAED